MAFKDLREYLALLEQRGQLKRVSAPVSVSRGRSELDAVMRLLHEQNGPALILEQPAGSNAPEVPLVFNPFGTRERTAWIVGESSWLDAKRKVADVLNDPARWKKPVLVDRAKASCKEWMVKGDDISLDRDLPAVWYGKEGPSYVCNAVSVSRDPDSGERNVGCYRYTQFWNATHPLGQGYTDEQIKRRLAGFVWWNPPMNHIGLHFSKAARKGKPLPVALASMADPVVHLAGATGLAYGVDEFEFAGGLRGSPVELVKCETVDLEVPAHAEWVIEGELVPGEPAVIGPHGNPGGYYDKALWLPEMRVNCITRRKDPMWYTTQEMVPPFDHVYMALLPVEAEVFSDLKKKIPEVKDVAASPNLSFVVQLSVDGANKPHAEFGKYVLHAVWGSAGRWGRTAKMVVVVGPDVDPYDWNAIEWALMTRVQPYSDTIINRSAQAYLLDPSAPKSEQGVPSMGEQIGIDATIKVPERFKDYPETANADPKLVAELRERLAPFLA
ncbi:MAG: UbiD family decarboxylase [Steroidobacteraceae bacterium]